MLSTIPEVYSVSVLEFALHPGRLRVSNKMSSYLVGFQGRAIARRKLCLSIGMKTMEQVVSEKGKYYGSKADQ